MTAPTDPSLAAPNEPRLCPHAERATRAIVGNVAMSFNDALMTAEAIRAACEAAASEARREERERCRSICEEFLDKHQHDENLARWHCAGDIQERIESGT